MLHLKSVTAETWARTVFLFICIVNQILAVFGKEKLEIYESDLAQLISLVMTVVSTVAAWWKNNSFTPAAQEADRILEDIRAGGGGD